MASRTSNDSLSSMAKIIELMQNMRELTEEGFRNDGMLFRLETYLSQTHLFYLSYIQPAFGVMYFLLLALMGYVMFKLKIRTFVIDVFFLCSVIKCAPRLLLSPLHLFFTRYYNAAAPMLYPWCLIYLLLTDTLLDGTHLISINLNIMLAINRICSVYFPFKLKIWFSGKRNKIYLSLILVLTTILSFGLNHRPLMVSKELALGQIEHIGKYKIYQACSLKNIFIFTGKNGTKTTSDDVTFMTETFMVMIFIVILSFLDAVFLIKLWKLKHEQISSFEGSAVIVKKNSSRMLMLNKIASLIISFVVIVEIPRLVLFTMAIFQGFSIKSTGYKPLMDSNKVMHIFSIISYEVFAPLDILIFLVCSKKISSHFKEKIFCRKT